MIRAVIFTLLALSVRAANYGHSSYLSGIPSYSYSSYAPSSIYGSGLFGSLYGSGLTYGSGLHHGSGLHYGSGLHHGSGLHYASGLGHGLHYGLGGVSTLHGGHAAHLTSAIRPSIYSSRYDIQNPSGIVLNKGHIISNVPGKMEFIMGGAGQKHQIGAIAGQAPVIKYTPRVPYSSGAMLSGGFFANEAPAKIEFVLGGTGYKTGAAAQQGHGKPAIHKYAPVIPRSPGSVLSSGVLANNAPGKMEFVLGDSGYKAGAAAISGQTKPIVLKSSPALRRIGQAYGVANTDPSSAHIVFNQDFQGVSGLSGIVAPKHQNININKAGGLRPRPAIVGPQRNVLRTAGGLAHSSVHGQAGFSPVQPVFNVLTGAGVGAKYTPRVPYSSGAMLGGGFLANESPANIEFVFGDSGFKTGAAAVEGHGKPTAIHSAGMYGVERGQSAISASRSAIRPFPKVSSPITGATLPRIQSRNAAAIHGGAVAGAGQGRISFNQDFSRIGRQSQAGIKPQILSAPVVGSAVHHGSGIDAASLHSAGISGISAIGGHENIHSVHDAAVVAGLHSSGVIPAAPVHTAGAIKPSAGNIHRANLIHKSGAHGLTSGAAVAGPHMSFSMGQSAIRKPGVSVASLDKAIAPAVATSHGSGFDAASLHSAGISGISAIGGHENILSVHDAAGVAGLHSSGIIPAAPALTAGGAVRPYTHNIRRTNLIHKSGAHGLTSGPHMSFNMGEATLRKPGMSVASIEKMIAPAVASRPISLPGIRGVSPNLPVYGSSGVVGPAGISFTQDFSKVFGSQTAGVQPVLSINDKLSAPIIPGVLASPRIQGAPRNTAGFFSSSITKPVPGALTYRAPKQPGSLSSSLVGPTSQGGSIFARGAAINAAEGHAMDFKQGVSDLSGQLGGRLASSEIAPESGVAHIDRSSALAHSTAGAAIPSGIVSGVQRSSAGIRSGSLQGSAGSLGSISGDKSSIILDGEIGDKSTLLFHSTGIAGTSGLLGDQGSIIELVPAGIDTVLPVQGMSRSSAFPAFPSFPSSSHSGFSHVLREHGTDKSLFYSAGSPNLVRSVSTSDIIRK